MTLRPSHGFAGCTSTLVPLTDTRRSTNVYVGAAVGDRLGTGTLVGLIVLGFLVGAGVGDRLGTGTLAGLIVAGFLVGAGVGDRLEEGLCVGA